MEAKGPGVQGGDETREGFLQGRKQPSQHDTGAITLIPREQRDSTQARAAGGVLRGCLAPRWTVRVRAEPAENQTASSLHPSGTRCLTLIRVSHGCIIHLFSADPLRKG